MATKYNLFKNKQLSFGTSNLATITQRNYPTETGNQTDKPMHTLPSQMEAMLPTITPQLEELAVDLTAPPSFPPIAFKRKEY